MLYKDSIKALWTEISIEIFSEEKNPLKEIRLAFEEIKRIEKEYSRFIQNNQLSRLNSNLNKYIKVSSEFFDLIQLWKNLEEKTKWTFSLTVKTILDSWWYNDKYELNKESWSWSTWYIFLKEKTKEVLISSPIELWSLGKWYALDRVKDIFEDYNDIFINAWWDIYTRGWRHKCFLENPLNSKKIIWEILVVDGFLAASSPLKRRWRNRHHLVNAKNKETANEMAAVYVLMDKGVLADVYSTALFSLWYDEAKKLIRKERLRAMIIWKNWDIFISVDFWADLYISR